VAKIEQEANTACQDKCVAQVLQLEKALAMLHGEVESVRAKHEIARLRQLQDDASDKCDALTRKCDVLQQHSIVFQVRSMPFHSL
jgi:phage shock protein A